MPYNWTEFLDLACFLQGGSGAAYTEQAAFRSAVGRSYFAAYFAAYNHAVVHAEGKLSFTRTRKPEDHANLREHLQKKGKTEVASLLDELEIMRNTCDYDDTKPIRLITAMVAPAITKARDVISKLP